MPFLSSAAMPDLEFVVKDGCLTTRSSFLTISSLIYTHVHHAQGSHGTFSPGVTSGLPSSTWT